MLLSSVFEICAGNTKYLKVKSFRMLLGIPVHMQFVSIPVGSKIDHSEEKWTLKHFLVFMLGFFSTL